MTKLQLEELNRVIKVLDMMGQELELMSHLVEPSNVAFKLSLRSQRDNLDWTLARLENLSKNNVGSPTYKV